MMSTDLLTLPLRLAIYDDADYAKVLREFVKENDLVPDGTGVRTTLLSDRLVVARIDYDPSPDNPLTEWDGMGRITSFSHRHSNYAEPTTAWLEGLKEEHPDFVWLSYYEHGNCLWFPTGLAPAGVEFQWDGTRYAGVWVPDVEHVKDADAKGLVVGSPERYTHFFGIAESICKTYTAWCNGWVYNYSVEAYALRFDENGIPYDDAHDYRRVEPIFQDSLCGIYDDEDDYLERTVLDAVVGALEAA